MQSNEKQQSVLEENELTQIAYEVNSCMAAIEAGYSYTMFILEDKPLCGIEVSKLKATKQIAENDSSIKITYNLLVDTNELDDDIKKLIELLKEHQIGLKEETNADFNFVVKWDPDATTIADYQVIVSNIIDQVAKIYGVNADEVKPHTLFSLDQRVNLLVDTKGLDNDIKKLIKQLKDQGIGPEESIKTDFNFVVSGHPYDAMIKGCKIASTQLAEIYKTSIEKVSHCIDVCPVLYNSKGQGKSLSCYISSDEYQTNSYSEQSQNNELVKDLGDINHLD